MRYLFKYILLCFLIVPVAFYAQAPDTLTTVLKENSSPEARFDILVNLAKHELDNDADKSIAYVKEALTLKNIPDEKMGLAYHTLGTAYYIQNEYAEGMKYLTKALKLRREINDSEGISSSLTNIGLIYDSLGDDASALEYFLEALKIDEETNNKLGKSKLFHNIALIYSSMGLNDKAYDYFLQSLTMLEELGEEKDQSNTLQNLALLQSEAFDNDDLALSFYYEAEAIDLKYNNKRGLIFNYSGIGEIYLFKQDFEKANNFFGKCLALAKEIHSPGLTFRANFDLGRVAYYEEKDKKSLDYMKKAYEIAEKIGKNDNFRAISYWYSIVLYADKSYKKAYDKLYDAHVVADSLFTKKLDSRLVEMKVRFETKKIEEENLKLEAEIKRKISKKWVEKVLFYVAIFISVLLITVGIAIYRRLALKAKLNNIIKKLTIDYENTKIALVEKQDELKQANKMLDEMNILKKCQADMKKPLETIKTDIEALKTSFNAAFIADDQKECFNGIIEAVEEIENKLKNKKHL